MRRKLVCPLPEVTVAAFEVRLRHDRYAETKFDRVVVRLYCLIYSINTEKSDKNSGFYVIQVISLAAPFFGLIFIGFGCGKLLRYPEAGLQWMNFYIVYLALPGLFFKLISAAPFDQLSNFPFIIGTTLATLSVVGISFFVGMWFSGRNMRESAIQGVAGGYANVGYMGPGLTIAALGPNAIVPTALIFVFDNLVHFSLVPMLMAAGSKNKDGVSKTLFFIFKKIVTHPFNIATSIAIFAAYIRFEPPAALDVILTFLKNSAAPCALFTMGVTVALRPINRIPNEIPILVFIKLILHPLIAWIFVSAIGDFGREWTLTAVLMASLPTALNVFVLANQYHSYVERASTAILISTLGSVFTVTGLLYLISTNTIPYRFPLF
jgi:predicted permease